MKAYETREASKYQKAMLRRQRERIAETVALCCVFLILLTVGSYLLY